MTLKHDADGFLVGDPLDLKRAVTLLDSIQSDVRAMRQALVGEPGSSPRVSTRSDRAPVTPVVPVRSSTPAAKSESATAVTRQIAAMVKASKPAASPVSRSGNAENAVIAGPVRDSRGRFVGKSGGGSSSAGGGAGAGSFGLSSDGFAKRVAAAVTEGISDSEEADPTVKAMKEVAEPMKRGYRTIFGDQQENKQSGWFRRIVGELKGIRTEQTLYEKATVKAIKGIDGKSTVAGEDGGSWISMLITGVMRLGPLLIPIATSVAAMAAGIALLVKLFGGNGTADKEVVEDIQKNIAEPIKEGMKEVGFDKDAEIEGIREKNRREQNGTDEYERMDRARAAVASAGVEPASPEYNESLSQAYQELERQDTEAKKGRLARAWAGIKSFGSKVKDKAFRTGASYSQGNIDGLDDAHTRALVASTAETESGGGSLDITNKQGYMGRYQAGAAWLADAGLIRGGSAAVKAAIKAGGYKSEWAWAQAGGMSKFLNNQENWVNGMSREKYLASAEIQDGAFKVNSDRAYADLVRLGAIKPGDSQEQIAGLLKARHIAGLRGALSVASGGTGAADANGTTARKYYEDVAKNSAEFIKNYSATTQIPQVATGSMPTVPAMPVPPQIPDAPEIQVPISLGDSGRGITVITPAKEPGQDLSNRRMAHIVTGGYSSA